MTEQLLNSWPMAAVVLVWIYALNVLLVGLYKALEVVKGKTKTKLDDKVYNFVFKLSEMLQNVLDFVGYNPKH